MDVPSRKAGSLVWFTFGTLNLAFSRLLLGEFLTIDEILSLFMRLLVNIVLGACTLHVVAWTTACHSYNLWFQALPGSFLTTCHFSYHEIFFLKDPRVSKCMPWIKMTSLGWLCDNVPWASMRWIQNDSNSSLVPDLYIDIIFSIFMTRALFQLIYYFACLVLLFLTISQMLDLREKLGVTIQHLIGPNNEQMLLGCCDSTKVHPKVIKPLWKAKMAYSYTTCNTVSWRNDFFLQVLQYPLMCCSREMSGCQDMSP